MGEAVAAARVGEGHSRRSLRELIRERGGERGGELLRERKAEILRARRAVTQTTPQMWFFLSCLGTPAAGVRGEGDGMVGDGEGEAALWWCSRCYRVTGVASSSPAPLFEGYHSCPGCPGVCLLLPARFGEYARSSLVLLASHGPASPVPLAELGRIVGFARSQHAAGHRRAGWPPWSRRSRAYETCW